MKFIKKLLMKTIKTIVKFEGVTDRYTDGIDDNGLMIFLSRVDTDDGFAVYEMPFCFKGFRVHNVLLNIFGLVKLLKAGRQKLLLKVERHN